MGAPHVHEDADEHDPRADRVKEGRGEKPKRPDSEDIVDDSSFDSFPASDSPSWYAAPPDDEDASADEGDGHPVAGS